MPGYHVDYNQTRYNRHHKMSSFVKVHQNKHTVVLSNKYSNTKM